MKSLSFFLLFSSATLVYFSTDTKEVDYRIQGKVIYEGYPLPSAYVEVNKDQFIYQYFNEQKVSETGLSGSFEIGYRVVEGEGSLLEKLWEKWDGTEVNGYLRISHKLSCTHMLKEFSGKTNNEILDLGTFNYAPMSGFPEKGVSAMSND